MKTKKQRENTAARVRKQIWMAIRAESVRYFEANPEQAKSIAWRADCITDAVIDALKPYYSIRERKRP